jgi:hypothetical protein
VDTGTKVIDGVFTALALAFIGYAMWPSKNPSDEVSFEVRNWSFVRGTITVRAEIALENRTTHVVTQVIPVCIVHAGGRVYEHTPRVFNGRIPPSSREVWEPLDFFMSPSYSDNVTEVTCKANKVRFS